MARRRDRRDDGRRAAIAMIDRLEGSAALAESCDPGWDERSVARPMRNIVFEAIDQGGADREWLQGFCAVLSGSLGIMAAGCVPTADELQRQFRQRSAFDRKAARAKRDRAFQGLLSAAINGPVSTS